MSQIEVHSGPEFAVALRGYERTQVDEYIARLSEWLTEWKDRAAAAEAEAMARSQQLDAAKKRLARLDEQAFTSTPASIEALGDRVGQILQTAFDAAEAMRTEARGEIDQLRQEAEAAHDSALRGVESQSEEIIGKARAEAERVMNTARVESERLLHEARATRQAMAEEIEALRGQRDAILAEVARIHTELAELLRSRGQRGGAAASDDNGAALGSSEGVDIAEASVTEPTTETTGVVIDLREGAGTKPDEEEPAGVA